MRHPPAKEQCQSAARSGNAGAQVAGDHGALLAADHHRLEGGAPQVPPQGTTGAPEGRSGLTEKTDKTPSVSSGSGHPARLPKRGIEGINGRPVFRLSPGAVIGYARPVRTTPKRPQKCFGCSRGYDKTRRRRKAGNPLVGVAFWREPRNGFFGSMMTTIMWLKLTRLAQNRY